MGQKRFGLEGAESVIPTIDAILSEAADDGMHSAIIGMAHRGRLNVLVNIVGKSYGQLFREFEGAIDPDAVQGSGDVKYHLGMSGKLTSPRRQPAAGGPGGQPLAPRGRRARGGGHGQGTHGRPGGRGRPPTVPGSARRATRRAAQAARAPPAAPATARRPWPPDPPDRPGTSVLPLILHGDAAFAGQGVRHPKTLHMSQLDGYSVGGTIHLIINNQGGFTATASEGRSSPYPTDVARMVQAPIFHVNGDDPEACVRAGRLAFRYRQRWGKDVVIDLWCYPPPRPQRGRRPSITQPLMYNRIAEHRPVRKGYVERLMLQDEIDMATATEALDALRVHAGRGAGRHPGAAPGRAVHGAPAQAPVGGAAGRRHHRRPSTSLRDIYQVLGTLPEGFSMHPRVAKHLHARDRMFGSSETDWALAETLAFGSLLRQGISVRLSGQDSRRGTFSQRHSTFVDNVTGAEHTPLAALCAPRTRLWIYDSLLSEYAALGFEYGYSLANPQGADALGGPVR